MKKPNQWFILFAVVILVPAMIAGIIYGMSGSSGNGMKMDNNAPPATKEQKDEFVVAWKKAFTEAKLNPDQLSKLSSILENGSKQLKDNFTALTDYREKQKKAGGDEAAKLKKRVDLKESERDVIVSQIELSLKDILSKDQLNLVMMAGFHSTSLSMSGDDHSPDMKNNTKMSESKLDQMTMDLGKLAEKLNQNCEAVSLELVLANLK